MRDDGIVVIAIVSFLSGCVRVDIPLLQPLGDFQV